MLKKFVPTIKIFRIKDLDSDTYQRLSRYTQRERGCMQSHLQGIRNRDIVEGPARAFVAYSGPEILGWALGRSKRIDGTGDIELTIFTRSMYRRIGIGTALVAQVRKHYGSTRVYVMNYGPEAIDFYSSIQVRDKITPLVKKNMKRLKAVL
jgi:GNAT superfamily N-acetyltransferase